MLQIEDLLLSTVTALVPGDGVASVPDLDGGRRQLRLDHGKPADAGPLVADLLPLEAAAAAGHRRHHRRHAGEHRRRRGRRHPRLRPLAQRVAPARHLPAGRVRQRPGNRPLPVPGGPGADVPHRQGRGAGAGRPSGGRDLPGLRAPPPVHDRSQQPARPPQRRRGVPGAGAGPPRDAGLPEGDPEAAGLGRTALRPGSSSFLAGRPGTSAAGRPLADARQAAHRGYTAAPA
jgi:hypothetical protein